MFIRCSNILSGLKPLPAAVAVAAAAAAAATVAAVFSAVALDVLSEKASLSVAPAAGDMVEESLKGDPSPVSGFLWVPPTTKLFPTGQYHTFVS